DSLRGPKHRCRLHSGGKLTAPGGRTFLAAQSGRPGLASVAWHSLGRRENGSGPPLWPAAGPGTVPRPRRQSAGDTVADPWRADHAAVHVAAEATATRRPDR